MAKKTPPTPDPIEGAQNSIQNVIGGIVDAFTPGAPAPTKRKTWDELSAPYRRRLEKAGITREKHATGEKLHKARGHISAQKESSDKAYRRNRARFVAKLVDIYGRDEDEVEGALEDHTRAEIEELIERQTRAEQAYDAGRRGEATGIWEARTTGVFDEFTYYYHGVFS